MNFNDHPYSHIFKLINGSLDAELEYSIYEYQPQSVFDKRTIGTVKVAEISSEWLAERINSLKGDEEFAFHSKIKQGKIIKHIPFIDLDCPVEEIEFAKSALRKVLPPYIFSGLQFYDSGRSLHAYGSCLLTRKKWVEFMGNILLANFPESLRVVDTRWVGHRLLGGFSSLRWSSNSGYYEKLPEKVK